MILVLYFLHEFLTIVVTHTSIICNIIIIVTILSIIKYMHQYAHDAQTNTPPHNNHIVEKSKAIINLFAHNMKPKSNNHDHGMRHAMNNSKGTIMPTMDG